MRDDLLRRLFKGVQEIERQSQEGSGAHATVPATLSYHSQACFVATEL